MDNMTIPGDVVVFDTETTGFSPLEGDKLVELGAVKMKGGLPTRETFHRYINPQRSVPKEAFDVHGLDNAFLADKPLFEEVAQDFCDFVGGLPMVAHNAPFDALFINTQLSEIELKPYPKSRFIDTIPIARKKYPGQMVSLDALCRKMKISLDGRDKHGALIDSMLLAEVIVELMGGRQATLFNQLVQDNTREVEVIDHGGIKTKILHATPEEIARHDALVEKLGPDSIWAKYAESTA